MTNPSNTRAVSGMQQAQGELSNSSNTKCNANGKIKIKLQLPLLYHRIQAIEIHKFVIKYKVKCMIELLIQRSNQVMLLPRTIKIYHIVGIISKGVQKSRECVILWTLLKCIFKTTNKDGWSILKYLGWVNTMYEKLINYTYGQVWKYDINKGWNAYDWRVELEQRKHLHAEVKSSQEHVKDVWYLQSKSKPPWQQMNA